MYSAFDSNMLKSKMLFVSSFSSQLEVSKPIVGHYVVLRDEINL